MIKYIFSINAGRCGSDYLSCLFNHVEGCRAFHEPLPIGNGSPMRSFLGGFPEPMKRLVSEKIQSIQESTRDGELYVETNHCFIKGFGWVIPEFLPEEEMGVIILKRDKRAIAQSLLRMSCTPLTLFGRDWIMTPDVNSPIIPPPSRLFSAKVTYRMFRFLKLLSRGKRFYRALNLKEPSTPRFINDYELSCLEWYVEETLARAEQYQRTFPRVRYVETNIDDLNSMGGFRKVLDCFCLKESSTIYEVLGKPTNVKR